MNFHFNSLAQRLARIAKRRSESDNRSKPDGRSRPKNIYQERWPGDVCDQDCSGAAAEMHNVLPAVDQRLDSRPGTGANPGNSPDPTGLAPSDPEHSSAMYAELQTDSNHDPQNNNEPHYDEDGRSPGKSPRKSRRWRKWAIIGASTLAVLVGAWFLLFKEDPPPPYVVISAANGDIQELVSANGYVKPVQDVVLSFKDGGYVEGCFVKVGDPVQEGQLMAEERADDFQTQIDAASSSVDTARANYKKICDSQEPQIAQIEAELKEIEAARLDAQQSLQRSQQLYEAGGLSQSELDKAQKEYDSCQARYESAQARLDNTLASTVNEADAAEGQLGYAEAQLENAVHNMEGSKITAPFDGYVAMIQGNVGQWTSGGAPPVGTAPSSQFSIRIASRELQAIVLVNEADIGKTRVGQDVEFTVDAYPGVVYKGRVTALAPIATETNNVKTYEATISVENPDNLKGGMPVAAKIKTSLAQNTIIVPQAALSYARAYMIKNPDAAPASDNADPSGKRKADHRKFVLVLKDSQPELREIQTGISDLQNVEILSGLNAGDQVITGGGPDLSNDRTGGSGAD